MCSVITIPNYDGNGSVLRIYLLNHTYMDLHQCNLGREKAVYKDTFTCKCLLLPAVVCKHYFTCNNTY